MKLSMRAYENGKPADTPHYFKWRGTGPRAGEPVFVSGHPGSTSRQLTMAELDFLRDVVYPSWLIRYSELRGRMLAWADTSDAAARAVQQRILLIENGLNVRRNQLKALLNDDMMARKAAQEWELREAVMADAQLAARYGNAWKLIDKAVAAHRNMYDDHLFIEDAAAFNSGLFDYARDLVRGSAEREKPNEKRLREYTDAALPRVESQLLADRPIDKGYEKLALEFSLAKLREYLGPDSRYVKLVLGKASPAQRAAALVEGSRLEEVDYRREPWEGGADAVAASDDPMIRLALAVDDDARALRKRYEDAVEAPQTRGEEMIADASFRIYGTDTYPDATFTLRITYGAVDGWPEKGEPVEPFTHTGRLFERTTGEPPFALPASWQRAREQLDPEAPFDFVATTDITGGNSGSPMIAFDGTLVGIAFDGNIHSIAGDFWFDPKLNRTLGVDTAIILEALRKVYGADRLLRELTVN